VRTVILLLAAKDFVEELS